MIISKFQLNKHKICSKRYLGFSALNALFLYVQEYFKCSLNHQTLKVAN